MSTMSRRLWWAQTDPLVHLRLSPSILRRFMLTRDRFVDGAHWHGYRVWHVIGIAAWLRIYTHTPRNKRGLALVYI